MDEPGTPSGTPTGDPAARRIRATVAFASLTGFTDLCGSVGPERAYLAITGCMRRLDGIARRHGGAVDKYLGDSLMLVFGHPVPLTNPAHAAVRAAVEMREEVASEDRTLALPVRIGLQVGIATGEVVAGRVGDRVVREFHVLGDAVNLAARLKARAPAGGIWIDETTRAELGYAWLCRPVGELSFKGKARPVPVLEVVDAPEDAGAGAPGGDDSFRAPLVGREAELERLRALAASLSSGRGGFAVVVGVAGAGKSRLLAELGASPEAQPALRLGVAEARAEPPGPGRARIVIAEDVDRAAPDRIADLLTLAGRTLREPILLLASARDAAAGPARTLLDRARDEAGTEPMVLALPPLSASESEALMDAVAGASPLPPAARGLLAARAAGLPGRIVLGVHLAPSLVAETDRSERAERSTEAERRRATIVFADLSGFTAMTERLGAATAYPIVSECMTILDDTARRHGGHAEKHLGDAVMATFGLPEAIEDAPRAALNAAIDMRERVRRYVEERSLPAPLEIHVGIHTGLGIAGDVSGPLLREFAVMGDPVVVAEQLANLAGPGQIFVGGDTARFVSDRFDLAPREPLELPGSRPPVAVFELRSRTLQLRRDRAGAGRRVSSSLVGRDAERGALEERLAAVREGRGGVVALTAEAGLGKSRLVAELAARGADEGVAWLEGVSLSNGRSASFHPFADLLRAWAGITEIEDEASSRARLGAAVRRALPDEADTTLPVLAALVGLRSDDVEEARLARLQGDALERLVRRAVTQVLVRASEERPLVVVMDDLHWADDSSVELLTTLLTLSAERPVLFVLVTRPGFEATSGRVIAAARAIPGATLLELRLAPLTRAATRQLLANLFEMDELPHETRAAIEEKAQGNPFFVEEVVRSLVDEGAVEVRDGRFRVTTRIHDVVIPPTVEEVIQARVDRLPLRRRSLLQIAAVIGRSFGETLLGRVVDEAEGGAESAGGIGGDAALDRMLEDVRALEVAEFVVPWAQGRSAEWAFKHPLIHEVVYDTLLESRRAALHRRVALALETMSPEEVSGWAGMLALHFGRGQEPERAEAYLFRAGEEAARVAASSEALFFFETASKLYFELHGEGGDPEKKARLERQVARALSLRGRLIEADVHYDRALTHLGFEVSQTTVGRGLRFARQFVGLLRSLYAPARLRPAAAPRDLEVLELLWDRAQMQVTVSPTRFLFDSVEAIMTLDRFDPRSVRGAGAYLAGVVGIFSYGGVSFALSRRVLAKARPLVRADDPAEQVSYGMMHFLHHLLAGEWGAEHEMPPALVAEGLAQGQLWQVTNALNLEGVKRIHQGDFGAAAERIEALGKIAEHYQYDLAASARRFLVALLHFAKRELAAARETFDAYVDEHREPAFHASALGWVALARWYEGDEDGALRAVARAERAAKEAGRLLPYHAVDLACARYEIDAGRLERATGRERRALASRARRSGRIAGALARKVAWRDAEVRRTDGVVAWSRGRPDAAIRHWSEALERAERLGLRPEAARIRFAQASRVAAAGGGAAVLSLAAEARDVFHGLGLAGEAAAAAALCARLGEAPSGPAAAAATRAPEQAPGGAGGPERAQDGAGRGAPPP